MVVELIMASRTMPVFRATSARMATNLDAVLLEALECLRVPEADLAAAQLAAIIGGLTLDAVTPHGALSVDRLRAVLRSHLRMLLATPHHG